MIICFLASVLATDVPRKSFSSFSVRAFAEPRLRPILLPRPHGGTHEFTFAIYGAPTAQNPPNNDPNISAFANLTRAMKRFGVGNGFDPLRSSVVDFTAASKLGWPISFVPIQGGNVCSQVPGCVNNMTVEQHSRLKLLDSANVYYEIQFAEYGYWYSGLRPAKGGGHVDWWHIVFPNTTCESALCSADPSNPSNKCCAVQSNIGHLSNTTEFDVQYSEWATQVKDASGRSLFGFEKMPTSKQEAYEVYRDYYNSRVAWITAVGEVHCGNPPSPHPHPSTVQVLPPFSHP